MDNKLFRQSSVDRISSPEALNDYLRVARPSVWLALAAMIILLVSFVAFGFYGTIPGTVSAKGIALDGEVVCYVMQAERISPGMPATIGGIRGTVLSVSPVPLSEEEINEIHPEDFLVYQLDPKAWNYPVRLSAPGIADGVWDVVITTETIRPIEFLLEGGGQGA
ncbi:MAG: hypothetical protein GX810_04075 [Clostridiales bacterium]|nr:hypothetical protein [Clostridiales bacterium]